jgi:hypothetical protein
MRSLPLYLGALCVVLGCGGGGQTGTVSGRVTMDGKPLPDAVVNFQPMSEGRNSGIGSSGRTDANGEYTLRLIDDTRDGAIIGKHRVMIKESTTSDPTNDKRRAGGDLVPAEYHIKSTLTFEVKPGHNTANWDLESKKKK